MRKKTIIAATLAFLILASAVLVFAERTKANPIMNVTDIPRIKLLSPQPTLYYENNVNLSFYGVPVSWGNVEYSSIKYWLDGELKGTVNTALAASEPFSANLTGIPDGQHYVEVTATVTVKSLTTLGGGITANVFWGPSAQTSSGRLNFTTDTTAPSILVMSQPNRIFETVDVPLNFIVSESVSELTYSLDAHSNLTFSNDAVLTHVYGQDNYCFTLNGTEQGSHSLKIYAQDAAGYTGESETYYFTVNTQPTPNPTPTPTSTPSPALTPSPTQRSTLEPTPTEDILPNENVNASNELLMEETAIIVALAVALGALIYLGKRKKQQS